MSGILPQVTYNPNNNESANEAIPERTATASAYRLRYKYRNIDFEHCFLEMCLYLKRILAAEPNQNSTKAKKYKAAQRALYPDFGAVGSNRKAPLCSMRNLEVAAYYWMAACDEDPQIPSSTDDRRACFARALYECERGNNNAGSSYADRNSARINYVDNDSNVDDTICAKGVNVNFAEAFVGMHPDVDIVSDLQPRIFDLVSGFIAKHCYTLDKTWQDLMPSRDEALCPNLKYHELVLEAQRAKIRANIIKILGIFGGNHPSLMAAAELNYLDNVLNCLKDFAFVVPAADRRRPSKSEAQINADFQTYVNKLVVDADEALLAAVIARPMVNALRFSVTNTRDNFVPVVLNFAAVSRILKAQLPIPTHQVEILTDDGYRTRSILGDTIVTIERQHQQYITLNSQEAAENKHRQKLRNRGWMS